MTNIRPGTTIAVELSAAPRSQAARKTLIRLFKKDARIARQVRQRKDKRPSEQSWIRGGRFWRHRMKSAPPVKLERGARYTLRATVDVLRDLESVKRWVKVTPAGN